MEKLTRRTFFKTTAAALATPTGALAAGQAGHDQGANAPQPAGNVSYMFFRPDEARFVEAATERLIPADSNGPGALAAGVPSYIDRQLGGAWGAGERLYRSGPWRQGIPGQGYQLPFTPAELFHNALRGIDADLRQRHNTSFDRLPVADQDAYLKTLQNSKQDFNGVPGSTFFESLLALTIEGFFADPIYGGNRDMVAWKMIGFPGAYASYYELVDQYGLLYTRAPMSIGETGRGTIQIHKASPPAYAPSAEAPARKGGK
ncbi:gluconate 2-dehydrogenase subunit 3 family protein [Massilia horti]|uniref:Gluconate 2-dehydrogenase subunit 3 family protein n=1 Tax=Massilia horti TaxID=2562153 RepID=A0A4Y9SXR6_9BURK|nr:gluconate 2-dehydrogenase subunit 3 family protein [Massilia horti]TFW31520.1 gluconate 2-dehydrogenase subunit 3 family protein [Massilia horti]